MKPYYAITLLILLVGCYTSPQLMQISKIEVRDSEFNIIRVVDQPQQLEEVNRIWRDFEPIDTLPNTNWTHKIDIKANQKSGRWLYNAEEGYIAKLNFQLKPAYKIIHPDSFKNTILDLP